MFNKPDHNGNPRGQSLIEALIGVGILAIALMSIALLLADSFRLSSRSSEQSEAASFTAEGINAARSIAKRNWNELVAGSYGLAATPGYWILQGTSDVIGEYTRQVIVENVNRDGGGDIVLSGGSNDTETKKITSRVTWQLLNGATETHDSVTYVTRWFSGVLTWVQTTFADFTAGKRHGVVATNLTDGEIMIDTHGPYTIISNQSYTDLSGSANAASVFVDDRNHLFVGRQTDSGGAEFFVYDAGDGSNFNYLLLDSEEIGANVNAIVVQGDYAFLATSADAAEIRVYKLSTRAMVSTLNMAGSADALSLAYAAGVLYVGRAANSATPEFVALNASSPEGSLTSLGTTEIGFAVNGIAVSGAHAFLATADTGGELQVIRLSDYTAINEYNASGNNIYYDVKVEGTTLFVASDNGNAELEAIDISTPAGALTSVGSYSLSGNNTCRALEVFSQRVAIGCDNDQLHVVDASTFVLEGSRTLSPVGSARDLMFGDGYLYAATTSDSGEIQVIKGVDSATAGWLSPVLTGTLAMSNAQVNGIDINGSTLYAVTTTRPGEEFYAVDISDPTSPSVIGGNDYDALGNDVWYSGNYAYVATGDAANEIKILDITTPASPAVVGQLDLPGSQEATSLFLSGTRLLAGRKAAGGSVKEFVIVDVSIPALPLLIGQLEIGSDVNQVYAVGNYAYLATAANSQEIIVVDMTIPVLPVLVAALNVSGNTDMISIDGSGTWLFAGRDASSSAEFYVYDITVPTNLVEVATLEVGGALYDMSVSGNLLAGVSSDLWMIDIANLPTPNVLSVTPMGDFGQSVKLDGDCVYVGSSASTKALQIFCKDESPPAFTAILEGNFRSQSFDASGTVVWSTIYWTATVPSGTALSFQVRTADALANLPSAVFVGPDGTPTSFYTVSGTTIVTAPSATGSRFVEWQAYLSTTNSSTPTLENVTLEYQ